MRYSILFLFVLTTLSCQRNNCPNQANIEVSNLLCDYAQRHDYDYCKLLNEAETGNSRAINDLSLLEINDAPGYDHGAVLIELIHFLGEKKYLESIAYVSPTEKNKIRAYLDVGLEYGVDSAVNEKSLKHVFPSVYQFLTQ